MGRNRHYPRLRVYQNDHLVGCFLKQSSGAVEFVYDDSWLNNSEACPVSLSLPLREDAFKGRVVSAVFENLLPDSDDLRRRVAERIGADGTDAYSLLLKIGRDCIGALRFVPEDEDMPHLHAGGIEGEVVDDEEIERVLNNLARAPLGLERERDFRISVAGAQEKTAFLFCDGKWMRPRGTTPTTHIFKTQMGSLPNGIDLSNSVENEYYSLALMRAFGLDVNEAQIKTFGKTKSLVIKRFDRRWISDKKLIRLPQEDCCQALSMAPTRKYQSDGGPGMVDILDLLKASDTPADDQKIFLKAQILFWLIGATDGHAKNFSIFLGAGGRFHLTPIYDVLTAQPFLNSRQIERREMKLAMSVGDNRHYRLDEIYGRHFVQTVLRAGLPEYLAKEALEEIHSVAGAALTRVEADLPADFPEDLHVSTRQGLESRLNRMQA